jgi:hypothetical protein
MKAAMMKIKRGSAMKWWLILSLAVLITLLLGAGLVSSLVVFGPFDPADGTFYQGQRYLEELYINLANSPTSLAEHRIWLAERRIRDLNGLSGGPYQFAAIPEVDQALHAVVEVAAICPSSDRDRLQPELLALFQNAGQIFRYVKADAAAESSTLTALQVWITDVIQQLQLPGFVLERLNGERVEITLISADAGSLPIVPTVTPVWINPHIVYFLPGSAGAKHQFYPLLGQHAVIDCLRCHSEGTYAGTRNQCENCHKQQKPGLHYPGRCELCHAPTSWLDIHYQHTSPSSNNCAACHAQVRPVNHYPGQCSACHSTAAWIPAQFDHVVAQAVDCQSCHAVHRPNPHWNGQCSLCHTVTAWSPASFNHSAVGATDCQSCHGRPAGHWGGQCSACHSTSAWLPASFNHSAAGATDCISCHINRRPANHYDGQCSACHSTSAWKPANFNHSFPMNHGGANSQCATCHPSGTGSWTCFNCHNQGELDKKHDEKGIPNYASRCLSCHAGGESDDD